MSSETEKLLSFVEKPGRYLGTEVNAVYKEKAVRFRFVLAFPDTYEVGMSHLGMHILYEIINNIPSVACERCFAPWPDMERLLRKKGYKLFSLETKRPLCAFDMVGFSLQYELSYTNVLNMLDLGGIPVRRKERRADDPIVIAGGPCAFNPAPLSEFIDVFVIGEGEEVIQEIIHLSLRVKEQGYPREERLLALSELSGVYVPAVAPRKRVLKRVVKDINNFCLPTKPVIPLTKIIHDRISLEIARGCTRGCRFCQAGMILRPVREREVGAIEKMAENLLLETGYDEISLLSLSAGDYTHILPLIERLMDRYSKRRIALALPSLRVETLTKPLMEHIRRVRKTSFTLAPEAGTERLRKIINKGNTERELLETARCVFASGWPSLKLYFMLGLPGEREDDLEGIVALAHAVLKEGKGRHGVTVSLSTFVPKPHTPFQWQRQVSLAEIEQKQAFLKKKIRHSHLFVKWHEARMSLLEGLISRGDERMGELIFHAFQLGARFDGWSDQLVFERWERAIKELSINVDDYLGERPFEEELPWDHIDCGVNREFLIEEAKKAQREELTPDCRFSDCHFCGVCKAAGLKTIEASLPPPFEEIIEVESPAETVWQVRYEKRGLARFLSHLELMEAMKRALNRAGVTFGYTQGFHPHPKIVFASATAVGIESLDEYLFLYVKTGGQPSRFTEKINIFLPDGLRVKEIREVARVSLPRGFTYILTFPAGWPSDIEKRIADFSRASEFRVVRSHKGKTVVKDIRAFVSRLSFARETGEMKLSVSIGLQGTVRPQELLTEVIGLAEEEVARVRIVKIETLF